MQGRRGLAEQVRWQTAPAGRGLDSFRHNHTTDKTLISKIYKCHHLFQVNMMSGLSHSSL